jgi:hypothetical protein
VNINPEVLAGVADLRIQATVLTGSVAHAGGVNCAANLTGPPVLPTDASAFSSTALQFAGSLGGDV